MTTMSRVRSCSLMLATAERSPPIASSALVRALATLSVPDGSNTKAYASAAPGRQPAQELLLAMAASIDVGVVIAYPTASAARHE